jgi:hypothetical protein
VRLASRDVTPSSWSAAYRASQGEGNEGRGVSNGNVLESSGALQGFLESSMLTSERTDEAQRECTH